MPIIAAGLTLATPVARAQATGQQGNQPPPPAFTAPPGAKHPAFDAAERNEIPLEPWMIERLAHRYHQDEQAETEATIPMQAVPATTSVAVAFGPGGVTTIVRTVIGYPTALTFVDSTGSPWPIAWTESSATARGGGGDCTGTGDVPAASATTAGGVPAVMASGFNVCVPFKGSNTLEIMPQARYPRGGLLVNLENAPQPISFLLVSGTKTYDSTIDVRILQSGPDAKPQIIARQGAPETGAPFLTAMLNGEPPAAAVPLAVVGASPEAIRAWRYRHQLFLRTRDTVLSPEWDASEHGVGGVTIYAMPPTPVVLMSSGGHTFSVSFKED
ncbi:DotH/IcmK family type IV secretion protein [Acidiphilium sp.]|uniref:DotH/IcmK family type IV secretion protein n=1 Tax=Acidiphilium sp. TaxID=527 RepID=UPI003D005F66